MKEIMRNFWWMLSSREHRLELAFALVRELPGQFGILVRARVLRNHFVSVGPRLNVLEGARFRNIHKISLGDNVFIGNDVTLQAGGGISLGDNTLLGPGCKIWTQTHRSDDLNVPVCDQGAIYAPVSIAEDCWIGANAFIMPGVELARGCVVAAGSVVGAKKYKEFSILMGNPARIIGYRDKRNPQKTETPNVET